MIVVALIALVILLAYVWHLGVDYGQRLERTVTAACGPYVESNADVLPPVALISNPWPEPERTVWLAVIDPFTRETSGAVEHRIAHNTDKGARN